MSTPTGRRTALQRISLNKLSITGGPEIGSTRTEAWSRLDRAPVAVESAERGRSRKDREMSRTEVIFEVGEDELDSRYSTSALGFGIHTERDTLDELRGDDREAVGSHFDESMERPCLTRLHYVSDEALVV